jgi:hypothetical protein
MKQQEEMCSKQKIAFIFQKIFSMKDKSEILKDKSANFYIKFVHYGDDLQYAIITHKTKECFMFTKTDSILFPEDIIPMTTRNRKGLFFYEGYVSDLNNYDFNKAI